MHVVIVGNGIAGATAAFQITGLDPEAKVTVYSEEETALYSPCIFGNYLSGEIERKALFLASLQQYNDRGIVTRFGCSVKEINTQAHQVFTEQGSETYDKLILATGSQSVIPPIPGHGQQGVFTFKTLEDVKQIEGYIEMQIPERAVVIGSGPIGVELAIHLKKRGLEVSLVELLDRVMPNLLDKKSAEMVRALLEEHGVRVVLGERVEEIRGGERVIEVITNQRKMPAQLVGLAVGVKPRVNLAHQAGIELGNSGGITVDAYMNSSMPDVYACGDCVETIDVVSKKPTLSLLWHTAKQQACVAAHNCLGCDQKYTGSLNFSIVDVFGWSAISCGRILGELPDINREVNEIQTPDGILLQVFKDDMIKGVQFVGKTIPEDLGLKMGCLRRDGGGSCISLVSRRKLMAHSAL